MKKLLFIFCLLLTTVCFSQTRNHIIQSDLFDGIITGTFKGGQQFCYSYSQSISDTFLRYTTKSLRVEYRKGDSCVFGHRSEIVDTGSTLQERWFGLSIYLETGYDAPTSLQSAISQWHDNPDPGEQNRSPSLYLYIINGHYNFKILSDTNSNNCPTGFACTYLHQTNYDLGPAVPGVWHDWVYHFIMDYHETGIGLTQVWMDGILVLNVAGPNCYNDILYPYFKFGIYESQVTIATTPFNDRVLWFANVREGDAKATYRDVAPPPPGPLSLYQVHQRVRKY